jgi:hypothetical protein
LKANTENKLTWMTPTDTDKASLSGDHFLLPVLFYTFAVATFIQDEAIIPL